MPTNIAANAAANAYSTSQRITGAGNVQNLQQNLQGISNETAIRAEEGGVSFSDFMTQAVENSMETMRAGEEMSAKAVMGDADITDVVQAVTSAELTLQTLVSVRDRMISAYQDIMRMPI